MAQDGSVTFQVADVKPEESYLKSCTVDEFLQSTIVKKLGGNLLKTTTSATNPVSPSLANGFVGAAFSAYNQHHHLVLKPDDVWVAITTALAGYIDKHAEEMRHLFVEHEGKKELKVVGGGNILSADYSSLISQMSDLIDQNTKGDIREWLESDFSTTTPTSRIVSKVVLMGAMKNYFSYKMELCCGLPAVTLLGNKADWQKIRSRVDRLATWKSPELTTWSAVLGHVMDHFVNAFEGKVDTNWWNRIAHRTGGGSGPRYLEGWILSFIPWNDNGQFVLNSLDKITSSGAYGQMNTNDVPRSCVEVPVVIDDNGRVYNTTFYAGAIVSDFDKAKNTIGVALDWALIDVTDAKPQKEMW
jgi:hypothetical protein